MQTPGVSDGSYGHHRARPEVADELERILEYLYSNDGSDATGRIDGIIQAIATLEYNPMIGRPADSGLCELIIGRGSDGFVALYRYLPTLDRVFILAILDQREAGYRRMK